MKKKKRFAKIKKLNTIVMQTSTTIESDLSMDKGGIIAKASGIIKMEVKGRELLSLINFFKICRRNRGNRALLQVIFAFFYNFG